MKVSITLRKLKTTIFISVLFLAIVGLNSCKKSDDVQPTPSSNVTPLIKTEIIIVEKDQWFFRTTNYQAILGCTILPNQSSYENVKVYIKIKKDGSLVNIWQKLPNSTTELQIKDNKICIMKPTNWTPKRSIFMIEIKKIDSASYRYDKVYLNTIENPSK